jgi:hypothetical protein
MLKANCLGKANRAWRITLLQVALFSLCSAAILTPSPAVAQDEAKEGALTLIGSGEDPQAVPLDSASGAVRSGKLDILLRNESGDTVIPSMQYVLTGSGRVLEVADEEQATPPSVKDPVRINLVGEPSNIAPFETKKLSVFIRVASEETPAAAAGRLVVAAGSNAQLKPASIEVNPVSSPAWRWEGAVLDPSAVTIDYTRRLPEGLAKLVGANSEGSKAVTLHGVSADALGAASRHSVLSSSTGGTLKLSFVPLADQSAASATTGNLEVVDVSRAGKYEGNLVFDPGAKNSPKLPVTVNVRDFFLWPLLFLLAGTLVAWGALWWRDTRRPKELLRTSIKRIHERNQDNAPNEEAPDEAACAVPIYTYKGLFPDSIAAYPGWLGCKSITSPEAKKLYCDVTRSRSKEEYDDLRSQVDDLNERIELWKPTYDATKTLHLALREARTVVSDRPEGGIPLFEATDKLLQPRAEPPSTAAEAKALLDKLRQQTDALLSFIEGWKLMRESQELYKGLRARVDQSWFDSERKELHESDPVALYKTYLLPATTMAEITESNVIARMRQSHYDLLRLNDAYPPRAKPGGSLAAAGKSLVDKGGEQATAPLSGVSSVWQSFVDRLRDVRTPEEILASVRMHDWLDFLIAALISSLAFLIAVIYVDNFGSWEHYVAAFLAGASGSLAINWTLLPWARSYTGSQT